MEEAVICFIYHKPNKITRYHYELLKKINNYHVIPLLAYECRDPLDDTIVVSQLPTFLTPTNPWKECDLIFWSWFLSQRCVESKRYILVEWDTYCTQPFVDFYGKYWNGDVCGIQKVSQQEDPHWQNWSDLAKMPLQYQKAAIGLRPFNCLLLSHKAAKLIAEKIHELASISISNEIRCVTLANIMGLQVLEMPEKTQFVTPYAYAGTFSKPGIYHAVKSKRHMEVECCIDEKDQILIRTHNTSEKTLFIPDPSQYMQVPPLFGYPVILHSLWNKGGISFSPEYIPLKPKSERTWTYANPGTGWFFIYFGYNTKDLISEQNIITVVFCLSTTKSQGKSPIL